MRLIQKKDYDQILYLIKTTEGTGMIPDKGRDKLLLKVIKRIIESGEVCFVKELLFDLKPMLLLLSRVSLSHKIVSHIFCNSQLQR